MRCVLDLADVHLYIPKMPAYHTHSYNIQFCMHIILKIDKVVTKYCELCAVCVYLFLSSSSLCMHVIRRARVFLRLLWKSNECHWIWTWTRRRNVIDFADILRVCHVSTMNTPLFSFYFFFCVRYICLREVLAQFKHNNNNNINQCIAAIDLYECVHVVVCHDRLFCLQQMCVQCCGTHSTKHECCGPFWALRKHTWIIYIFLDFQLEIFIER